MTICTLCHNPVTPGQGVHGATGNHWDCVEAARVEEQGKFIEAFFRLPKAQQVELLIRLLRGGR